MKPIAEHGNAARFLGFAELYDQSRPVLPEKAKDFLCAYLGKTPETVVDLGCGTGLSSVGWLDRADQVIGVEPNEDMLRIARTKETDRLRFVQAFSDDTGLPAESAELVICSQSFHWMEPQATLKEAVRLLKKGGIFATLDCDWPPVMSPAAEEAYGRLDALARRLSDELPSTQNHILRHQKTGHLPAMQNSGLFRYTREIVFDAPAVYTAARLLSLAKSQGSWQAIHRAAPERIEKATENLQAALQKAADGKPMEVTFCYRLRLAITDWA